jgi:sarcosine oxidase delta subunit
MTDPLARLDRINGKWHVFARKGVDGAAQTVWLSLGGCADQYTATRVWLACLAQGKW